MIINFFDKGTEDVYNGINSEIIMRMPTNRPPLHPGEILWKEFMKPYRLTSIEIFEKIESIIKGQQNIDIAIALYLSELFGTSPELWLNGQMQWDIWHFLHGRESKKLKKIQPIIAPSKN